MESDCNTKYFHSIINWKRRKNAFKGLIIDGIWGEDPSKVKLEIRNFFLERFGEKERNRLYIDRVNLSQISLEEKKKLEARFEEEEIKEVAWDCLKI